MLWGGCKTRVEEAEEPTAHYNGGRLEGAETKTVQIQTNRQDERHASDSAYLASRALLARSLEQHQRIASHVGVEAAARRRVLVHTFAELMSTSRYVDPRAQLNGRIKSIASISGKMFYAGAGIHQVLDIIGIRAVTKHAQDCYRLIRRIHSGFPVLASEYDDYIAAPKYNGYRSLQHHRSQPLWFSVRDPGSDTRNARGL